MLSIAGKCALFAAAALIGFGLSAYSSQDAPLAFSFSNTDDYRIQYGELVDFVRLYHMPERALQIDPEEHVKVSQYTDIDSSASGYGLNACGLVAAAAATGAKDWGKLVDTIGAVAGENYHPNRGIQPTPYVKALRDAKIFGPENVTANDAWTLGEMYRELLAGHVVIIDFKVNFNTKQPSARAPNFAHFARVLGLDVSKQEIYIENTLRGAAYWSVPLQTFFEAWLRPETSASLILDPAHAENVTRWAVVIDRQVIQRNEIILTNS